LPPKDQLQASLKGGRVIIRTRTLLVRDHAHFALGSHTDSPNKFVTAAFYLPKDRSFEQFGTSISVPKQVAMSTGSQSTTVMPTSSA